MSKKRSNVYVYLAILVIVLATLSCAIIGGGPRVGELQTETQSIELGGAESVRVEIEMAAGELAINGGATELLEAEFRYNVVELKPEVNYSGDKLTIMTPDVEVGISSMQDADDYRYEWDLQFNESVPMGMNLTFGAGQSNLNLGSLLLNRLDMSTGAGDVSVDLSSSASLTRLEIEAGVGQIDVDLSGDWQGDLDAAIRAGVGDLTLRLPSAVGVRVEVESAIANISTSGLSQDGNVYVNDAYDDAEVTLDIRIDAGVGQVNLIVSE